MVCVFGRDEYVCFGLRVMWKGFIGKEEEMLMKGFTSEWWGRDSLSGVSGANWLASEANP